MCVSWLILLVGCVVWMTGGRDGLDQRPETRDQRPAREEIRGQRDDRDGGGCRQLRVSASRWPRGGGCVEQLVHEGVSVGVGVGR